MDSGPLVGVGRHNSRCWAIAQGNALGGLRRLPGQPYGPVCADLLQVHLLWPSSQVAFNFSGAHQHPGHTAFLARIPLRAPRSRSRCSLLVVATVAVMQFESASLVLGCIGVQRLLQADRQMSSDHGNAKQENLDPETLGPLYSLGSCGPVA